jgi:hypothetical protein
MSIVPDDLVEGNLFQVVFVRAGDEHGLVLHVGPHFKIGGFRQPNRAVAALVK